jgi:CubicO group peptidase (beta-lactamase class C family)
MRRSTIIGGLISIGIIGTAGVLIYLRRQYRNSLFGQAVSNFRKRHETHGAMAVGSNGVIIDCVTSQDPAVQIHPGKKRQYPIGSLTKQFTSAALLHAILEAYCQEKPNELKNYLHKSIINFIKYNDPIWGTNEIPDWAYEITLHHLLSNTSGLVDFNFLEEYKEFRKSTHTQKEILDFFKNEPLAFSPGIHYQYSNSNFFLAGVVIERLTGKTLSDYLKHHFFIPLKMSDTFLPEKGTITEFKKSNPTLTLGYTYSLKDSKESLTLLEESDYEKAEHNQGDGGLISTADNLIKWYHALYSGFLLPKEAMELMLTPSKLPAGQHNTYAYGVEVIQMSGKTFYTHEGLVPGYSSIMFYDPDSKLILVHLSNVSPNVWQYLDVVKKQSTIQTSDESEEIKKQKFQTLVLEYPIVGEQLERYRLIGSQDLIDLCSFKGKESRFYV